MKVNDNVTIEAVIKLAKEKNRRIDSKLIMKAYNYATAKHRGSV